MCYKQSQGLDLSGMRSGCSDELCVIDAHQSCILGSHTGSLHQELLVTKLHTIQSSNGLQQQPGGRKKKPKHSCAVTREHCVKQLFSTRALQPPPPCWTRYLVIKVDVNIFAEGVSFGQASGTVLHQVKGLQGAK